MATPTLAPTLTRVNFKKDLRYTQKQSESISNNKLLEFNDSYVIGLEISFRFLFRWYISKYPAEGWNKQWAEWFNFRSNQDSIVPYNPHQNFVFSFRFFSRLQIHTNQINL